MTIEPIKLASYTREELVKYIRELEKEVEFWKDLAESCECNN